MMTNYDYKRLVEKRDMVRKEIYTIMKRKDYYTNPDAYKRVRGLTGLESYLTYQIEGMEEKFNRIYAEEL
jgi:hypothetical protein